MGGKKGPEKNRKYEKDRRDRFNDQFHELNKLLPDFNSSVIKVTKAEIIARTIQYLKDSQSKDRVLDEEFKYEKSKISELQKKIAGLLQIIKELIKLLHKSNINFPSSLPIDDFVSFKEAYRKCKRKLKQSTTIESTKQKAVSENENEGTSVLSGIESIDSEDEDEVKTETPTTTTTSSAGPSVTIVSALTTHKTCNSQIVDLNSSNVLRVNTSPLIIPQANLLTVNGLLNNVNASSTILLNKEVTVPTLILMQNNIVPVTTVQQMNTSSSHKLIIPKVAVNTTKTIFMNKKPIPAVRLYKSMMTLKESNNRLQLLKRKGIRRSKGILVKYPKRKPPSKGRKKEEDIKKSVVEKSKANGDAVDKPESTSSFSSLQSCDTTAPSYSENNEINKNYTDNIFDTQDIQNGNQFMDFFENTNRSDANNVTNVNSSFVENSSTQKPVDNEFERPFVNTNVTCAKQLAKDFSTRTYISSSEPISNSESVVRNENAILDKRKCMEKEITPLTIQCNLTENKSITKDLNLAFDDKSKHYESSFDEFSNDLFLHVPSSGQNADSISPTAAFLSNFPLVSSFKNADLLPEHEEDSNAAATNSTTILQIGNLGSPSTLLFTNKSATRDSKVADKDENFVFCSSAAELENRDKKKECKETTPRDVFNLDTFINQPVKGTCSKESITQNIPFYPTSTNSSFPSYSMLTKYNDIPAVTCSYYSFTSQPFPVTKTSDLITDYNSWMPTYNQEEANKDKKREKATSTSFRNTFGLPVNETPSTSSEKSKPKKSKQSSTRALVNWMTSPDSRNAPETLQPFSDVFSLPKDDPVASNTFLNSPNVQNNTNFTSYSSTDYFLDNQSYADTQLNNKITYSSANPTSYSWSPSKTTLPTLSLDTPNMMIPSTLPTLVGDLALGNNYDPVSKKYDGSSEKKKNYQKTQPQNASSFLSVTQLVDGKSMSKKSNDVCQYSEARNRCYKENYNNVSKNSEKNYSKTQVKCRKEAMKCNNSSNANPNRCLAKENKKDHRVSQKLYEYSSQSCQMTSKEVNPLSNKNSNYSAESLIGSNTCSSQNYFTYENSSSYNNCATNKKAAETDSLANVGYYANTNYMYANNFQTFNNYGFSNQYCNNYTSQVQHSGFQKKKEDSQPPKQDTEWYKDNFSSYSTIVPTEFANQSKEKCKQTFANKYNCGQKNISTSTHSGMYNSYYQYGASSSSSASALSHTKSSCNFNSTYSFSQAGQQCAATNCQPAGYEMKLSRHSSSSTSTNAGSGVMPATTLTNFNLSTIIPEINDKHCMRNRVNTVGNEKSDPKYSANNEMNYNYLIQPPVEGNIEPSSVYGSSGFQVSHYPDFTNGKNHK